MASHHRNPPDSWSFLRCAIATFAAATLFSGLAQRGDKPVYFVLAAVAGGLFVLLVEPERPSPVLRSPLVIWAYLFLIVTLGWGLWRTAGAPETDQAIVDRFRSMAFLLAMVVVFEDDRARRTGGIAVVAVAVISSGVNVAEAFGAISFPGDVARIAGRAAGLYRNPNGSALAIVFGLAAGLSAVPRMLRVPALTIAACGVAATFSRGAAVCLAVVVVILLLQRELPPWQALIAAAGAAGALVASRTILDSTLQATGALNSDTLARLAMTADDSGRGTLAMRAWQMFLESPWLGHGVAAQAAGRDAHNMYLSLGVEHGLIGVMAYPAFILALGVRNRAAYGTAAVCVIAAFTSHNLLDSEPALLCCALAAAGGSCSMVRRVGTAPVPLTSGRTSPSS